MSFITKILRNPRIQSFLYLILVQGGNFLLPLLTMPYVSRVVGVENFGMISYSSAFVVYFTLIVQYGFEFTATRDIAVHKSDIQKVAQIFWSVTFAKSLLFVLATLIFGFLLYTTSQFGRDKLLMWLTYLTVAGNLLTPMWLFQGMEKLKYVTIVSFLLKASSMLCMFIFVKQSSDFRYVAFFTSFGIFIGGVYSFYYGIQKFRIPLLKPDFQIIIQRLQDGFSYFISTLTIHLYTTGNTILLGFFATDAEVGYFTSASRLIAVIISLIMIPMNLTAFPMIGVAFQESIWRGHQKLLKVAAIVLGIMLPVCSCTWISRDFLIQFIFGKNYLPASECLLWMSLLPFIIGLSNVFALQGLLALRLDKALFFITLLGAILSIALNFRLAETYRHLGTTWAWLITEIFITISAIAVYLYAVRQKLKITTQ
ncbi:MAG: flippase [Cytophagales bacterium]|nr:flippase [Cytophagales bacterium]MDW8384058.1 flippase [Flammeovirgaceae bacterium]